MPLFAKSRAYVALTKPTILLLVLITGAAGLVFEGSLIGHPARFALALLLLAMSGGSANAFNQYFERDIDAAMTRTRMRRSLPLGKVSPVGALIFASLLGVVSTALFYLCFNWLAALLSLGTILFYAVFYTLYLKPRTPLNIVIGGAAGAMAPVIAWAAASGRMALTPWVMFLIVFLWTPPHFWSLALVFMEDYRTAKYPMMPLVVGEKATWRKNIVYIAATIAASLSLVFLGAGALYLAAALILGALFYYRAVAAQRIATPRESWRVFSFSIVYLLALFAVMIVDRTFRI